MHKGIGWRCLCLNIAIRVLQKSHFSLDILKRPILPEHSVKLRAARQALIVFISLSDCESAVTPEGCPVMINELGRGGNHAEAFLTGFRGTLQVDGDTGYAYIKATLEAIAAGHPAAKIDELMPWNFQK